jgi:glutamate-5-semialdehyde dehydrogenase
MNEIFKAVSKASRSIPLVELTIINQVLTDLADEAENGIDFLLAENKKDLALMDKTDPKYDRLMLTPERIKGIAQDIRNVATLDYPVGKTLSTKTLPNGLEISKVTVPLGVIGIVYEARPNVTFDVFSLCLKSGNACILKGGSDAAHSNAAIVSVIKKLLPGMAWMRTLYTFTARPGIHRATAARCRICGCNYSTGKPIVD